MRRADPQSIVIEPQPGPQEAFCSSRADIAIYGGAAGGGKAQPLDAAVYTPFGRRTMGDIHPGSVVCTPSGKAIVIAEHPQGVVPVFRVTFDDGASTRATADHLWVVRQTSKRTKRPTDWRIRTTAQIAEWLQIDHARGHLVVPLPSPVQLTRPSRSRRWPIHPYALGALIGDGCLTKDITFTTMDQESICRLRETTAAMGIEWRQQPSADVPTYRASPSRVIVDVLAALGLHGSRSEGHFIPEDYLSSPLDVRWELLRGLFDADGYVDDRGHIEYTTVSSTLASQVQWIVRSLGGKATLSWKRGSYLKNGVRHECQIAYRIYIRHPHAVQLFSLPRKRARCIEGFNGGASELGRRIVAVEHNGEAACKCITIDDPNRLYLTDDFIVTHNSWGLLFESSRGHSAKGFSGVIFRRTYPQIKGGGSIWEESTKLYPLMGGRPREGLLDWKFPSGATIEFRHLQHEINKLDHQGKQYAFIGFDELCQFSATQFWYLISRNRSMCGIAPYVRATCNPDPDSWVRDFIDWWIDKETGLPIVERSGVLRWFLRDGDSLIWADNPDVLRERYPHLCDGDAGPLSVTFIPALLDDNPALLKKDPGYRAKLMALQHVDRERLSKGNWNVRATAGSFFRRSWFDMIDHIDERRFVKVVRAWDIAATEAAAGKDPDWTVGAKMGLLPDGRCVILHVERMRGTPGAVEDAILRMAQQDGPSVIVWLPQDPGAAGVSDLRHKRQLLRDFIVHSGTSSQNKIGYAKPLSAKAEKGGVAILRGAWNEPFLRVLESFPEGHDDDVDAASRGYLELNPQSQSGGYGLLPPQKKTLWPGQYEDDDDVPSRW